MLNVLIPVPISNVGLFPVCAELLEKNFTGKFELVVVVDGGLRKDIVELERALAAMTRPWRLLHNQKPVYFNAAVREGLEICTHRVTAVLGPQVRITDPKWFDKFDQIFMRSLDCGIVDTEPGTKSKTVGPVRRTRKSMPVEGCNFFAVATRFAKASPVPGAEDPVQHWTREAIAASGTAWCAPGISYYEVRHEEHKLWQESALVSASQSPKTQGSSSATTTTVAGTKASPR